MQAMSDSPSGLQSVILDLISTPDAIAPFDDLDNGGLGSVGLSLDAVFGAVYSTYKPRSAQRIAVHRAIQALHARGLIEIYSRRACPKYHTVAEDNWDEATLSFGCCGWPHLPTNVIGRL
jgi:hypothetical protein